MKTVNQKINVIKRDGIKEAFDPEKISRVVEAAGLTKEQSKLLAQTVTDILVQNRKNEVTSFEIRKLVIEELYKVNTYAADLFSWYEKTKD